MPFQSRKGQGAQSIGKPTLQRFLQRLRGKAGTSLGADRLAGSESAVLLDRRLTAHQPYNVADSLVKLRIKSCSIHAPYARFYPKPSFENSKELVEQIAKTGGNTEPILVRTIEGDLDGTFAVLVGTRRFFAVNWLNHNGYPDMRILARIVSISDEEAFLIAERENSTRKDISDLARARGLRLAKDLFYGGVQSRLATALGVSKSHVSGIMALASLPDAIVSSFGRSEDLKLQHAEQLAPLLRSQRAKDKLLQEALRIDREQQKLAAADLPLLPAQLVVTRLRNAGERSISASVSTASIYCGGEDVGSIWRNPDGMIQLGAAIPPGVAIEPVTKAIESALRSLR